MPAQDRFRPRPGVRYTSGEAGRRLGIGWIPESIGSARVAYARQVGEYMAETSRILTALGLVAASVGFTVYGIGVAFVETADFERNLGLILMIAGVIAAAVGIVMSRQIPEEE